MEVAKAYMRKLADLEVNEKTSTLALLSLYIVSSVLYYEYDISIIEDHEYDFICRTLRSRWDEIQKSILIKQTYKDMLDRDMLDAGSGYSIRHNALDLTTYNIIQYMVSKLRHEALLKEIR